MLLELTTTEAGQVAIAFLMDDLEIPTDHQEWFSVLNVRLVGET